MIPCSGLIGAVLGVAAEHASAGHAHADQARHTSYGHQLAQADQGQDERERQSSDGGRQTRACSVSMAGPASPADADGGMYCKRRH